jgi:hypothetical protein
MALSTPYCTLQQLQDRLRNEDANTDATALARHEDAINRASRMMEAWCHTDWTIHTHTSSKLVPKNRWIIGNHIYFPWPIKSITAVEIDGAVEDADDWGYETGEKVLAYAGDWPKIPLDNSSYIQVTGTLGYTHPVLTAPPTDADFPEAVREACIITAAALTGDYRREVTGVDGAKQDLLTTEVPEEARKLLQRHRRHFW